MKLNPKFTRLKRFTLVTLSIFIFASCQMTERLNITDDGSGKLSMQLDGSGFMQMMGSAIAKDDEKMLVDSIIDFKTYLEEKKDSIAKLSLEEQKQLRALQDFKMRININSDSLKLNFDMFKNFDKVEELSDAFGALQRGYNVASKANKKLSRKGQTQAALERQATPSSMVYYSYTGKGFSRRTEILDPEKLKSDMDSLGGTKAMFSNSKYKLIYRFPKRVKKASTEDAYFSADGKTVTIEKGFMDYLANPKVLDFSLEFEE